MCDQGTFTDRYFRPADVLVFMPVKGGGRSTTVYYGRRRSTIYGQTMQNTKLQRAFFVQYILQWFHCDIIDMVNLIYCHTEREGKDHTMRTERKSGVTDSIQYSRRGGVCPR